MKLLKSAVTAMAALALMAGLQGVQGTASAATNSMKCESSGALTYRSDVKSWYLSSYVPRPEDELMESTFGYGTSWYSTLWPLFKEPVSGAQAGLAATWIDPRSTKTAEFNQLPDATKTAFTQTIEGSLGWWGDSAYRSTMPKYEPGVTINDYSSGARDFWAGQPIPQGAGGWITVSNQILLPPEGMSFTADSSGKQLGQTWLALPLPKTGSKLPVTAGKNAWTLFLNSSNFKGPLAYVEPNYWALSVKKYPALSGMTFDNQMGLSYVLSGEFAGIPICEMKGADGTVYSKIPQLQFPADADGHFIFARDYRAYSTDAIAKSLTTSITAGSALPTSFDSSGVQVRHLLSSPSDVFQGGDSIPALKDTMKLQSFSDGAAVGFDLQSANTTKSLPMYFAKSGNTRVAVDAAAVPAALRAKSFVQTAKERVKVYQTLPWFNKAGKAASKDFTTKLNDGSVVTYRWYKFVDQPQLARYNWTDAERATMQKVVEQMQREWAKNPMQAEPTGGSLATFDSGLLVKPPAGMTYGYVPIIVRQANAAKS